MKVTAVTVTYGNRFSLVNQVIDSLLREQVDEIWVVDNNSSSISRTELIEKVNNNPKIKLISFLENLGSAGAYHEVFKKAFESTVDQFFWLIDDDNVALPGALSSLILSHSLLKDDMRSPVLYSYRGDAGKEDPIAVTTGLIKGPRPNTFCGFQLADLFQKNKKAKSNSEFTDQVKYPVISVKWGPYGGMFTNLANFKKIGLPRKEMVLYADDQEYSFRFFQNSIPQYLIYSSKLKDIDHSVGEGGGYFGAKTSLFKIFYGLRNTAYLSKKSANNILIYTINKWVFISIMGLLAVKNCLISPAIVKQRFPWIWRAMRDGEKGKLEHVFFN